MSAPESELSVESCRFPVAIFAGGLCGVAGIAEWLPVRWLMEQVRAINGPLDVIELRGLCRFAVAQAFGTQAIERIAIKP